MGTAGTEISVTSERVEFARFVAPLQARPESHVAMVGIDEVGIAKDLEEFGTTLITERNDAGEIVGAAGYDFDEPLQRGFLYGPWSIDESWHERVERLLAKVLEGLPAEARELEAAFDTANRRLEAFCETNGFTLVRDHFGMAFVRDQRSLEPDPGIREMDDDDRAAVMALHERCFEGVWPNGEQLMEHLAKSSDRRIFVLYEGDHLAGYHFAWVDRETGEASVDTIGVDERFRGRGFATRLLTHGLWWMFGFPEVEKIELWVRQENAPALQVYEKAGFERVRAVRQVRKAITGQP